MYRKFVHAMYCLNMIGQALFSLCFPAGVLGGIGWILTEKFGVPTWIYVPLLVFGFLTGFVSMIKFLLTASAALSRLEKEAREKDKSGKLPPS